MALGSGDYLKTLKDGHPEWFSGKRKSDSSAMQGAEWGGLRVMRKLRTALLEPKPLPETP
jgi:hypothetical protein